MSPSETPLEGRERVALPDDVVPDSPERPASGTDSKRRKHVVEFAGGMASLVGEKLDQRLRCHPGWAGSMRLGAFDTCLGDNRLFRRQAHSPWLHAYTLGQQVTNFHAMFELHEQGWQRDLPLRFLASKDGIPGCNLKIAGTDKQPVVAAALNAMEAEGVRSWLAHVDASFDPVDRTLLAHSREASYVAGTGGTGFTSALVHAAWRSQMDPSLFQRLIIMGPELYPTAGDTERRRRHQIILASLARTMDRMVLVGTDPEHPHFGGLLPGFTESLEPGCLGQIILVEGSNGKQTLTFEDSQRMVSDYLYYLSEVPEVAALLAVQLGERLNRVLHAARRTPFIWSSISFHVAELWRELPRVAGLAQRSAVLSRMRAGSPASAGARFESPITQNNMDTLADSWERRLLSTAPGTLFRLNSLRQRLKDTPESAATDALAAIREIPSFVDGERSGASITEAAEVTFRALRGLIRAALPNLGVERVLRELASTRVALGERTQEALPLAHFLNAVEVDAVEEEARSVQTAKSGLILAMGKRPGIFGQLSSRVRNRILYEQREATEALDGAVASLFSRVCRIADAVLRNALNAKLEELRSHYRSYLDQLIRVLEGAQAELSEEGARVAGQVDQVVAEGRMERSATRLSLFPSDAVLQQVAHVDEQSVASAFEVLFSWDGSNLPRRTDRPLEDVASFAADADVPFAPLFLGDANAKSFITDALRDAEPFVRINERGLQGLASVTRRVFLVYPKALAPFVETLSTDRSLVHLVQAQVPAIFVFKQADTLPSSAFQSLCEYDTVLQAALAADAREQDGVVETLISFPLARYRRAPRVLDSETAKRHRRAAASLLLNPEVGAFDSDHPDAGWARFSLVARNGSRVPILGPDAPMHAQCPLFQNNAGIWHIRFLDHRGNYRERSMGTHVLAYALDLVAQHGRYQAAISAWIEQCAQACGPDVAEAFGLALSAFEQWCRDAEDDIRNELGGDAEAIGRRNLFTEVLPPADMVCTLARELTEPDEWFLQFGVRYENQRLFPGVAAAAGAV